jgi:hypothetical protein
MRVRGLVVAVAVMACLGLAAVPALATEEYVPGAPTVFGSPGSAAGQLNTPEGVAVNEATHDVYVADSGNDRVDEFEANGTFVRAWGWGVAGGLGLETCTVNCQKGLSGSSPGEFAKPSYVAIDNSTSASTGDVYVADTTNNTITKFTNTGTLIKTWGTEGQLKETTPGEKFSELLGIAVGASGELWAHDNTGNFDEFSNTGLFVTTFNLGGVKQPGGIALDSQGDIYAIFSSGREASKISPAGQAEAEFAGGGVSSLAVSSSSGGVVVDKASELELYGPIVESGQEHSQVFGVGGLVESGGVAVDGGGVGESVFATERGAGDVRVFSEVVLPTVVTLPGFEVSNSEEVLSGSVMPEGLGVSECRFEYGLVAAEPGGYEHSVLCAQAPGSITGTGVVGVSATVGGLVPGATYHYRLGARNANGFSNGKDLSFTAFPSVGGASFSDVGSSSVRLHADVVPGGVPTSFFFEYGPTSGYGFVTPVESVGAGLTPVDVSVPVDGLVPDTGYHFRVVATSSDGVTPGADGVFSTLPVGVLGLPDGRGYELVSSLGNGDASVTPESGGRAAGDGSSVAYSGEAPLVGGNGASEFHNNGTGGLTHGDNQYLARRDGGGWSSVDIQPNAFNSPQYHGFTGDLSLGFLTSEVPLVEGVPTGLGLYARENISGAYSFIGMGAVYDGGSPDGSHVLIEESRELYELIGGELFPVNVLPGGGGLAQNASFGGPPFSKPDLSNAISTDGSRVFWSEEEPLESKPVRLFASENIGSQTQRTVQLDAPEAGCVSCGPGGGGLFWTASSDGSKAFFTDEQKLTADANAKTGEPDLYEYDLENNTITDITPTTTNPEEHANVKGVLGTSTNGAYVYFAAGGSLTGSNAAHQECSPAIEAQHEPIDEAIECDVYVEHEGVTRLVATVTNFDGEGRVGDYLHDGDWERVVGGHSSFVSADGRSLVFKSAEDLTGFDSQNGQEIYLYDYGAGLTCVSCNSSGALTVHGTQPYEFDAELPNSGGDVYALRDLSVDGDRVFFQTIEGLVSQDENSRRDVYEWERDGTGSCSRPAGCVFLLSGGTSTDESSFLDASETGDDVFIETRAQLVPQDHTELYEVFDARVGASGETSPSICSGSGCQGAPGAPPIFATPPSATFTGTGNFSPAPPPPASKPKVLKCKKGFVKKRGKCYKTVVHRKKGRKVAKKRTKAGKASHEKGVRS